VPRWVRPSLMVLTLAALVPFACVARTRVVNAHVPRVHLVQDMDNQTYYKHQEPNPEFADRRSMRRPVEGTVPSTLSPLHPQGNLNDDEHYQTGMVNGDYAVGFPPGYRVTAASVRRGQQRFDIYCSPCHGAAGYGDGMVARRADARQQATWVPPTSLHDALPLSRPEGHLFNTITHGIRTMPPYGSQIPADDRWAIVSYVRALQRSQNATLADVPPAARSELSR